MKIIVIISFLFLSGCINIAPDERWDGDDTRIWIKEASSLDLDPFWFKETESNLQKTVLEYKQDFEGNILYQVLNSKYYNKTFTYDSTLEIWKNLENEKLNGSWHKDGSGFKFIQVSGNQYPMTIFIDTTLNKIISQSTILSNH